MDFEFGSHDLVMGIQYILTSYYEARLSILDIRLFIQQSLLLAIGYNEDTTSFIRPHFPLALHLISTVKFHAL